MSVAKQFMELFKGLDRAYGYYEVVTTKKEGLKLVGNDKTIKTLRGEVNEELWQGHLDGKRGIGIVPITDESTCSFGAIDIDVYEGLDYLAVIGAIKEFSLPLLPIKSKSGGLHLYCFLTIPMGAAPLQAKLKEFAALLGFGGVEIFPKQTEILTERGDIGQWINMPYFDSDKTTRYALNHQGEPINMVDFLEYAKAMKVSPEELLKVKMAPINVEDIVDGPPCLEHLCAKGFPSGTRNDGLFNLAVYLRKLIPNSWKEGLQVYNKKYMKPPLPEKEVSDIAESASKKEYHYSCSKNPIKAHCNSTLCRTRKYGVGLMEGMPTLSSLTKYDTRPPIWFVTVENGGRLELSTEDLQNQGKFQKRCMELLNTMPQPIKQAVWQNLVQELLGKVIIIEAPADASPVGQLFEYLERFCTSKAQARAKDELLLGKPWLENGRHYFRLSDFISFLERQHFKHFTSTQISSAIKDRGGDHHFFNLKGKGINTWSFPEFAQQKETHSIPQLPDTDAF
jgi:hypothetical protein